MEKINEIVTKLYSKMSSSERETFDSFFIEYFGKDLQSYAEEINKTYKNTSESWNQTGKALEKIVFGINDMLIKIQESCQTSEILNKKLTDIRDKQILANYNPLKLDG
ncbi:MAG: hypothetical protein ABFQ65_03065 [Nanoarchaeota archaeon]